MYRFSTLQLLLVTTSFAAGFVLSSGVSGGAADEERSLDSPYLAFLLGAISVLAVVGLVQQILAPPPTAGITSGQHWVRRLCLVLLLIGLGTGVYRTLVPYYVLDIAKTESATPIANNAAERIESEMALPLWYFSLVLATLTAPWCSASRYSASTRNAAQSRKWGKLVDSVVFIGLFVYCSALAQETLFIFSLVDYAIQQILDSMQQGPAVGTPDFVAHFGRNPQQLREFVEWQVLIWPPLLVACFFVIASGGRAKSKWSKVVLLVCILPACVNLWRLYCGQAAAVFPVQCEVFMSNPIQDAVPLVLSLLLALMMLATRPVAMSSNELAQKQAPPRKRILYASDHWMIGWILIMIGSLEVFQVYQIFADYEYPLLFMLEVVFYPAEFIGPLMLLVGMHWQWRRFRFRDTGQERWPMIGDRPWFQIPTVAFVVSVTVLTSIPFGMALLHFNL